MLSFDYTMNLSFGQGAASEHAFTLRCLPQETASQHILGLQVRMEPETALSYGTDAFGNRYCYGLVHDFHDNFRVDVSGRVERLAGCYDAAAPSARILFRQFTPKTAPGPFLASLDQQLNASASDAAAEPAGESGGAAFRFASLACRFVHDYMTYTPGATTPATTAEEAARGGRGVCQDYSHILLSLCRMHRIPCRYTAGILIGEGASHAWVEVCDDGQWKELDPTNPRSGPDEKLIFSHGRDAEDCEINRGVYLGSRAQSQEISASLLK